MNRHLLVLILIGILLPIGCVNSQESPAPGCNKGGGCVPVMGGCFGKTVIQDLVVTGGGDCLKVRVNNCNGGVLTIENACQERLVFGEVDIPPADSMTVDARPTPNGQFAFFPNPSNFTEYLPESDQLIEISGSLGDQTVRFSFIKTAPLCE